MITDKAKSVGVEYYQRIHKKAIVENLLTGYKHELQINLDFLEKKAALNSMSEGKNCDSKTRENALKYNVKEKRTTR